VNLPSFEELIDARQSVRHFAPDPIPEEILQRLLHIAHQSPSGFNLQPVHYVVVQEPKNKKALFHACFHQEAIATAPTVIAFTADRDVVHNNLKASLQLEIDAGHMSSDEAEEIYKFAQMYFSHAPIGLGWVAKLLAPLYRLFSPTPELPAVYKKAWLHLHVGFNAMNFMLAAQSAGLSTCPIGAFDPWRVKRALKIPRRSVLPLLVAVGYKREEATKKERLPLEDFIRWM